MAYGSAAGVAALARMYTASGNFSASTNPTSTTVTGWLAQISATLDLLLAESGFATPVTQATAVSALDALVNEACSDMVKAANNTGRFFTERMLERGKSPMQILRAEMAVWIQDHAAGFEALGVARGGNASGSGRILYRESDEGGDDVDPLFQRKGYGETSRNWDR